jgi:MFS family permease
MGFNLLVVHPGQMVSAVAVAVRNDQVRRVELAWSATIAAEWAHFVALGVFAYESGGTPAVGVAGLVRLLPAAAVAPFAASLGDRFRRERFLAAVAAVGAIALVASAVGALVDDQLLVFVSAAFVGLCVTLVRPALQALLPSVARTAEELVASNGATSILEGLGTLVGPLLAGVLVSVADTGAVFAVAACAMLAAVGLFWSVRVEGCLDVDPALADRKALRAIAAGFHTIVHSSRPRLLVALIASQCFVRGCVNVLIVVVVYRVFDGGGAEVAYLIAAMGVGGLVGAFGAMTLSRRLALTFGVALVFWGTPLVLMASNSYFAAALILLAIVGAANSVEDVAVFTLLQRIIPDEVLTRVLGVVWGLAMGGVALGSIVAPALVDAFGPRTAFVAVGTVLPLLVLLSYRRLVEIDRTALPAPELELVDRVPIFAPLPLAAKDRVAGRLLPVVVPAGETVIHAGDVGDRFYIVGDGELEIDAGDLSVTVRRGDYFGEIALLRDVPRTATVRATVDSLLHCLGRDDFLAAVTGHSGARMAGDQVADTRLARARAQVG